VRILGGLTLVLLAGCVSMSESECRGADWYALGKRDGDVYGIQPLIDQYAYRCNAFGVTAQRAEYMTGWVDGYRERASRSDLGGDPN
jgi:hypothetical protein